MGDYSRFLTKMAELKTIQEDYNQLSLDIHPALSADNTYNNKTTFDKYVLTTNKNPMSNTPTPLVISPGEDYAEFWKYIGKITPTASTESNALEKNAQKCWNLAANDSRIFSKVVYTGNTGVNIGQPKWDNLCYGLVPEAPPSASYDLNSSAGYAFMVGNGDGSTASTSHAIYTKLGIKPPGTTTQADISANLAKASRLHTLQQKVNSLTQEIVSESDAGINNELNTLVASAASTNEQISKINDYMNDGSMVIKSKNNLVKSRKELSSVYSDINEQKTLRARKYQFLFFMVLMLAAIIGYGSYTSELPLSEQVNNLQNYYKGLGWWTNWWIIAIVVLVFIVSSLSWDMKGNLMTVIRFITDPSFWTGELWWVGIIVLLLVIIFFYSTFKSFFTEMGDGMKNIQSSLNGAINSSTSDNGSV